MNVVYCCLESLDSATDCSELLVAQATELTVSKPQIDTLLIVLSINNFDSEPHCWAAFQRVVSSLYFAATRVAYGRDMPLLSIDVVLQQWCGYGSILDLLTVYSAMLKHIIVYHDSAGPIASSFLVPHIHSTQFVALDIPNRPVVSHHLSDSPSDTRYDHVALGGTFDHLHVGHKILLSCATWICSKKLTCGVMNPDALRLSMKAASQYMQPLQTRINRVTQFLHTIHNPKSPSNCIEYNVVAIQDDLGPTRDDASIKALVGSVETGAGCNAVNDVRKCLGLNPLDVFLIDLISPNSVSHSQDGVKLKISSSYLRQHIADSHEIHTRKPQ